MIIAKRMVKSQLSMNKIKKITDRQRVFLSLLKNWLVLNPQTEFNIGGRLRDTSFFLSLVDKIQSLGQYTASEIPYLEFITNDYYNNIK
jgi:hypothetical protein